MDIEATIFYLLFCAYCATLSLPGAESLTSDKEPRWLVKGRGCPDWPFQFQILQLHKISRQIDPQALLARFATFVGDFLSPRERQSKILWPEVPMINQS
jgi:hypothetical protein